MHGIARRVAYSSQAQSILKTITWRIFATLITGVVIFAFTGKLKESGIITITASLFLTVGYYAHERFWVWMQKR